MKDKGLDFFTSVLGILAIVAGLLYMPYLPWYILGSLREAEIFSWAVWSIVGGIFALFGASLLKFPNKKVKQVVFLILLCGAILLLLAQIPALFSWFLFGIIPIEKIGFFAIIPIALHLAIVFIGMYIVLFVLKHLFSKRSEWQLSTKQISIFIGFLILIGSSTWGFSKYVDATFVHATYPEDGATDVPLHSTIEVNWALGDMNNMGMSVEYADQPNIAIQGMTSGSATGLTFTPNIFLPGKKVVVHVSAGRKDYSFSFTTADSADESVDLYRAALSHYFRAPQAGDFPEIIALDESSLKELKIEEVVTVAKGILAYHPSVLIGSIDRGFEPVSEHGGPSVADTLLVKVKKDKVTEQEYNMTVIAKRGDTILSTGEHKEVIESVYRVVKEKGNWKVTSISESEHRPWGKR